MMRVNGLWVALKTTVARSRRSRHAASRTCACIAVMSLLALPGCIHIGGREASPSASPAPATASEGLELLWSVPGQWTGVDVDAQTGLIYGLRNISFRGGPDVGTTRAELVTLTPTGDSQRVTPIVFKDGSPSRIRVVHTPDDGPRFLFYSDVGGAMLWVYDERGLPVWSVQVGAGIRQCRVIDLDRDGTDEIVTATTDGVFAYNHAGVPLWHACEGSWIWSVDIVAAGAPSASRLIASDSATVVLLDAAGSPVGRTTFQHAGAVLAVPGETAMGLIGVVTSSRTLQRRGLDGELVWSMPHADIGRYTIDEQADPIGRVVSFTTNTGVCMVVDADHGTRIAIAPAVWYAAHALHTEPSTGETRVYLPSHPAGLVCYRLAERERSERATNVRTGDVMLPLPQD